MKKNHSGAFCCMIFWRGTEQIHCIFKTVFDHSPLIYQFLLCSTKLNILIRYFHCFFRSADAAQPLSAIIPIPSTKLTPYRAVIIMRLIILSLFFHYRITHPVDSAFGLWLTSVICEIWFAFSWVLDQFPKWSPINRETFIDRLSARYIHHSYMDDCRCQRW